MLYEKPMCEVIIFSDNVVRTSNYHDMSKPDNVTDADGDW